MHAFLFDPTKGLALVINLAIRMTKKTEQFIC